MYTEPSIAAIILTKNEEKHIARCISSLQGVCDEVWVIDSFSTDKTREIARQMGANVRQHAWENYASQFNYAIHECPIKSEWLWRIDADEMLCGGLGMAVRQALRACAPSVNGVYVRKRIDFMGRPLLHGGWYPSYHLKVFRRGHGACEARWMDEHIVLSGGETITVREGEQVDANLNGLTWWTDKHNGYATREMVDTLIAAYGLGDKEQAVAARFWGTEEQRKRWLKRCYVRMPLFVRPFLNFIYRYVFRLGFLDGREGFVWHVLQGFWYRMLVDAKIYELKKRFHFDDVKVKSHIRQEYGV